MSPVNMFQTRDRKVTSNSDGEDTVNDDYELSPFEGHEEEVSDLIDDSDDIMEMMLTSKLSMLSAWLRSCRGRLTVRCGRAVW
eukprot:2871852-Prymnesium_polylepis.1